MRENIPGLTTRRLRRRSRREADRAVRTARSWAGLATGLVLTAGVILGPGTASGHENHPYKIDPAELVGSAACAQCHGAPAEAWKKTRHATTARTLLRGKRAMKIARALGLKRIKGPGICLDCHFTLDILDGRVVGEPLAGVSCESCHGGGKDWIKRHSRYGMKEATSRLVPPGHRRDPYADSAATGMIGPANPYAVASNCFGCHSVSHEELVNVGRHPLGGGFELVSWSQGEVRHNFLLNGENREASPEHKRMLYIVGKAVDLEFALRAMAKARPGTGEGRYRYTVGMARRARSAIDKLRWIAAFVAVPEIEAILAAAAELEPGNDARLTAAADRVATAARRLARKHYGGAFAVIDPLIPTAGEFKGSPLP